MNFLLISENIFINLWYYSAELRTETTAACSSGNLRGQAGTLVKQRPEATRRGVNHYSEQTPTKKSFWQTLDLRLLYAVILAALVFGFFMGDYFHGPVATLIRIGLLVVVAVLIYMLIFPAEEETAEEWGEEMSETEEKPPEEPIKIPGSATHEVPETRSSAVVENIETAIGENEKFDFYREIDHFFRHIVKMVKSTFVATSAVIFLEDPALGQLRIEYAAAEDESLLREGDTVDLEGTLPGMVFRSREHVLEQNIPDGSEAAGYYRVGSDKTVKSFLGVPIQVNNGTIGVLAIDSENEGEFGENDIELLESFQNLIAQGFSIMAERERYALVNRSLEAQQVFMGQLNEEDNLDAILGGLAGACRSVFQFDRLTISMVNSDTKESAKIVKVDGQIDEFPEGTEFSVFDGLTGWVIRKNRPLILSDLEKGDLFRPRFSKKEQTNYALRSFLGVPIAYQRKIYGALSLESKHPDFYSDWDQKILLLLASQAGLALSNMLNKPVGIEPDDSYESID